MIRPFTLLCLTFALAAPALSAPPVDTQALALLQRSQQTMLGLQTYQAECESILSYPPQSGKPARKRRETATFFAAKPNKMRYDQHYWVWDAATGKWVRDAKEEPGITFACDGKTLWRQYGKNLEQDNHTGPVYLHTILEPWGGFYHSADAPAGLLTAEQKEGGLLELRRAGRETVDGVPCEKVFDHIKTKYGDQTQEYWQTWSVGKDGLIRHAVERIEFDDKPGYTRDATIRHIHINRPIAATRFAYAPPPGVKSEAQREAEQPPLLAAGTEAPDFTATGQDGQAVKLSDFKGKVVVLDFWASWCPPCVASMPHNQTVAAKLQAEGLPVVLLAVDNGEERAAFTAWIQKKAGTLSALTFAHVPPKTDVSGKLYHVTGIPTQYVIDKNGIVRASFVGYGGPSDDLENAVRAALKQP